jgi:hypothetical protein
VWRSVSAPHAEPRNRCANTWEAGIGDPTDLRAANIFGAAQAQQIVGGIITGLKPSSPSSAC